MEVQAAPITLTILRDLHVEDQAYVMHFAIES